MQANTMMPENNRPGRKSTADEGNIYYMLRILNGLSMDELARYLHCHKNRICRLEQGKSVKFKVIQAFSELFGVSMDDLVRNNVAAVATAKSIGLPAGGRNRHKVRMLARVDVGDIGEELIADLERTRLVGTGYETCVSTNPSKNRRNGYDVISATADGQPKYIEVKTTVLDRDEPFFMTDAEYRKMKEFFLDGSVYELYRVYDLKIETMEYHYVVYTPQEVLDLFKPVPDSYRMVKREAV